MSNMNINFLVDKEKKRVVVSNQKGTMKQREYQDNIKKVLMKEDIVEELESDYRVLKINKTSLEGRLEDTNKKIEENLKKRKSFIFGFLAAFVGIPAYLCIFEYFVNIYLYRIGLIEIKTFIDSWLLSGGLVVITVALSPDKPFFESKRLQKEKNEYETYLEELDLEIADLVQVITKNKAELQELIEQQEKNNIELMIDGIQEVTYREELEMERMYLTQLCEENTIGEEKEQEKKSSILGRFKKKKQY